MDFISAVLWTLFRTLALKMGDGATSTPGKGLFLPTFCPCGTSGRLRYVLFISRHITPQNRLTAIRIISFTAGLAFPCLSKSRA
jgi:hypothetical protein